MDGCIPTIFCDTNQMWEDVADVKFSCPKGKKSAMKLGASIIAALAVSVMMW